MAHHSVHSGSFLQPETESGLQLDILRYLLRGLCHASGIPVAHCQSVQRCRGSLSELPRNFFSAISSASYGTVFGICFVQVYENVKD